MLTHNDVHILAAYLFTASKPGSLDIVLGDMVLDASISEARDVDVTFRTAGTDNLRLLTGVEVKDEHRPLDVGLVEQLAAKLKDMPSLGEKFIVSASGYSKRAVKKAAAKDVRLIDLLDFDFRKHADENWPGLAAAEVKDMYLRWMPGADGHVNLEAPGQQARGGIPISPEMELFLAGRETHPGGKFVKEFMGKLERKAAEVMQDRLRVAGNYPLENGKRIPADVAIQLTDDSFVEFEGRLLRIGGVRFCGELEMVNQTVHCQMKVLVHHGSTQPFVGGSVAVGADGRLFAMSFSPETRKLGIAVISPETRSGVIRNRKLPNS